MAKLANRFFDVSAQIRNLTTCVINVTADVVDLVNDAIAFFLFNKVKKLVYSNNDVSDLGAALVTKRFVLLEFFFEFGFLVVADSDLFQTTIKSVENKVRRESSLRFVADA